MPVSPAELSRIDAELDALAAGIDLERVSSVVRSAPRADLVEIDSALSALAVDVPIAVERPRPPTTGRRLEREAQPAPSPAEPEQTVAEPEAVAEVAAASAPDEPNDAALSAEALLNPFEEPPANEVDDDQTLIIDASELGGLDMDALFDGMVEEALSSPLEEGGIVGGRALPPISEAPPRRGASVEGATDIEQLRPDGDGDDLDLFVEDGSLDIDDADALEALEALEAPSGAPILDADDEGDDDPSKKKGFFKKLFG